MTTVPRISLHGRAVQYDNNFLYLFDRIVGALPINKGAKTWFVDSNVDGSAGASPDSAFGTLEEANNVVSEYDIVYVMPGHSETITGAGGLTMDVAGVTYIGLGVGTNRPTFLMDGAETVTALVSAADITISNMLFKGGHNDIVTCFGVTAKNLHLVDIEFANNTTDENFLAAVTATSTTDNTADGLTLERCKWYTIDAGTLYLVNTAADIAGLKVIDNVFVADAATGIVMINVAAGKSMQDIEIGRNKLICGNTSGTPLGQSNQSNNTGVAYGNYVGHHDTAAPRMIDMDGIRLFENYSTSGDTASGALEPAVDSIT